MGLQVGIRLAGSLLKKWNHQLLNFSHTKKKSSQKKRECFLIIRGHFYLKYQGY